MQYIEFCMRPDSRRIPPAKKSVELRANRAGAGTIWLNWFRRSCWKVLS